MSRKRMSDMHRCNKTAMIAYGITTGILLGAYLLEVIKNSRTIGYYAIFSVLALVPFVLCLATYMKNKETGTVKYIMSVGFSIFYMFIIFTTVSPIAYVYAWLIAVILLSYNEIRLTILYSSFIVAGNVIHTAWLGINGQITSDNLADIEIRVASVILFTVFMYMSTLVVNQNNQNKMEQIKKEKEKTEILMGKILEVSEQLTKNIAFVANKMETLETSASKTKNSMEEITLGNGEAVNTIQDQIENTEEISQMVKRVNSSSSAIVDSMELTRTELENSRKNIDSLIEQVRISNEANANVSKELDELYVYTNQMQSIVQMINEVTEQTSLLSLNASIEAARAGEAGKGFAVVATEISSLATQTQQATVTITELIENISRELSEVVNVIGLMLENVQEQNQVADNVAKSFKNIAQKNDGVYSEAKKMEELMDGLMNANKSIIDGIEKISAVTEEVTAHSNETLSTTEENGVITSEVCDIVEELNYLAEKLKAQEE